MFLISHAQRIFLLPVRNLFLLSGVLTPLASVQLAPAYKTARDNCICEDIAGPDAFCTHGSFTPFWE